MEDEICNFKERMIISPKRMLMEGMENEMNRRPLLLLVYADSLFAVRCSRFFRRRGWDVRMATSSDDLGAIVESLLPTAVIFDADSPDEFAAQSCDEIKRQHPGLTVVLSTANQFDDVEGLAERIIGEALAPTV